MRCAGPGGGPFNRQPAERQRRRPRRVWRAERGARRGRRWLTIRFSNRFCWAAAAARGFGGAGGAGGGSIKLIVGGNLRVDGTVSANGANGINDRSGGGSGGSIWLTCQNLSGAGVLSANGGAGEPSQGGGGGGGRISLQFAANAFPASPRPAAATATLAAARAQFIPGPMAKPTGQVLVDNGGSAGMSTPVYPGEAFDLTARGGAVISPFPYGGLTLGNLLVTSNAWISLSNQAATITVTSNATIQAGGGIIADGAGYPGGQGTGSWQDDPYAYTGGGGGYGGYGAAGGGTIGLLEAASLRLGRRAGGLWQWRQQLCTFMAREALEAGPSV